MLTEHERGVGHFDLKMSLWPIASQRKITQQGVNYILREGERGPLKFVKGVSLRGLGSDLHTGGGGT